MIKLINLNKTYGDIRAINNVTIDIRKGEITVLTGSDGAGKSTLLKVLLGLVKKDDGSVFLEGKNINDDFSKISRISGYMPELFSLYSDLTVEENLDFFAGIYSVPKKRKRELKDRLLTITQMTEFRKRRAGALSGGMKQKLALSSILLSSPDIIILDEPTTGVDPLSRIEFFRIIEDLKREGKTIVISTPYLDEAENGDRIIFLKEGKVLLKEEITRLKKEFPLELYKMKPEGNIFKVVNQLKKIEEIKDNVYIRGKYIKFLKSTEMKIPQSVKFSRITKEPVTLEDIYIYYERTSNE